MRPFVLVEREDMMKNAKDLTNLQKIYVGYRRKRFLFALLAWGFVIGSIYSAYCSMLDGATIPCMFGIAGAALFYGIYKDGAERVKKMLCDAGTQLP